MPKAMRIPMHYTPTGESLTWTVQKEPFLLKGRKGRIFAWTFTDSDGYTRWGGETWAALRDRFSESAAAHNLTHHLS